jgi:hypothetical protein
VSIYCEELSMSIDDGVDEVRIGAQNAPEQSPSGTADQIAQERASGIGEARDGREAVSTLRERVEARAMEQLAASSATINRFDPSSLDDAFALLSETLTMMTRTRDSVRGAALKSQMRKAQPTFEEQALSLSTFKQFLQSAHELGYIEVVEHPGSDLEILPANSAPPPARGAVGVRSAAARSSRTHIRGDLWDAFVNFSPRGVMVYEVGLDRVTRLPFDPAQDGPLEADLRVRLAKSSDTVFAIPPIPSSKQREWMADFVDSLPQAEGDPLRQALAAERPMRDFATAVRNDSHLTRRWRTKLTELVVSVIREWAADHELNLDLSRMPSGERQALEAKTVRTNPIGVDGTLEDKRLAALRIIQSLPLSELLQLRVPLEYLLA